MRFPWWLWVIAIVGCLILRFGQWLPPGRFSRAGRYGGPGLYRSPDHPRQPNARKR